jgi:hypothetical protein
VNYAEKEEKDRGSRRVISQLCLSKENRSSNDESKRNNSQNWRERSANHHFKHRVYHSKEGKVVRVAAVPSASPPLASLPPALLESIRPSWNSLTASSPLMGSGRPAVWDHSTVQRCQVQCARGDIGTEQLPSSFIVRCFSFKPFAPLSYRSAPRLPHTFFPPWPS